MKHYGLLGSWSFVTDAEPRPSVARRAPPAALTTAMAHLVRMLVIVSVLAICPVVHAIPIPLPCDDLVACPGGPPPNIFPHGAIPGTNHLDLNLPPGDNQDVAPLNAFSLGNSFAAFGSCFNVSASSESCNFSDTLDQPLNHWHWETIIRNVSGGFKVIPIAIVGNFASTVLLAGTLAINSGSAWYVDIEGVDFDGPKPVRWNWTVLGLTAGVGIDTSVREFNGVAEPPPFPPIPFFPLDPPGDLFTPIIDPNFVPELIITLTRIPEPGVLLLDAWGLATLIAIAGGRRRRKASRTVPP